MRGATRARIQLAGHPLHFNPRSSCEERPSSCLRLSTSCLFQSTLLMRGATRSFVGSVESALFQSTLLMRGATGAGSLVKNQRCDFNPRSSCEERQDIEDIEWIDASISIHAPHARSDVTMARSRRRIEDISIHAPHARSDRRYMMIWVEPL